MKQFKIEFNLADSEYLTALRLVAGAICSVAGKDIDCAEDFKVCVTESALILKNSGFERLTATFCTEDGVSAVLSGEGGEAKEADNELSLALIGALVGRCEISRSGGIINTVTLGI